jgi:hypothetical protein
MRIALLALFLAACQSAPAANRVVCGDVFNAQMTEASLVKRFGAQNVRPHDLSMEGQSVPATEVNDVIVAWKDERHTLPQFVLIPTSSKAETYEGIRIGTDLKTLEKINGAPFTMAGFAWDYAGTVMSWGTGKLMDATGGTCRLLVRLNPGHHLTPEQNRAMMRTVGDRDFQSSSPEMQLLNPEVYEIILQF